MATWCSSTSAPAVWWTFWKTAWRSARSESVASPMLDDVSRTLIGLRSEMLGAETHGLDGVADLSEDTRASARNLLHYLALRRHDLRALQRQLEGLGLSSLDGAESRVLGRIDAVLSVVQQFDSGAASGHANVDV